MKIKKIIASGVLGVLCVSSIGIVMAEDLPPAFENTNDNLNSIQSPDQQKSKQTDEQSNKKKPAFQNFSDVPVTHPYYNPITVLRYQGVINGYEDNTFHPEQELNRVEALKLIFEVAEIAMEGGVAKSQFTDTEEMAWYSGYLNKAVFLEVVNGYADGSFKPAQSVNLVEFLKMLLLAQKVDFSNTNLNQLPYADVMPGQWYSKYINYAKIYDLIRVDEDNKVYPGNSLTRARAADIIYRFRNRKVSKNFGGSENSGGESGGANSGKNGTSSGGTSSTNSNNMNSGTTNNSNNVTQTKDFALFVSTGHKFAIQYPKTWFYSGFIEKIDASAIAIFGFGPSDLSENPPVITLEILPNDKKFTTNMDSDGFLYARDEKQITDANNTVVKVVLSTKIKESDKIYRITGNASEETNMLLMLKSLTADIAGLKSYNPAEEKNEQEVGTQSTSGKTSTPAQ